MSKKLYELRQSVGRLMGSGGLAMVVGTPAATLSTTGFQCAALALEEDDYYIDWYLRFYSGTHKDITTRVTDFTQSGGVVVFSPAVTDAVVVTDLFELHRDFSPEEINNAINMAIQMVEDEALQDNTDETLVVLANTFEYEIPAGFYSIEDIYQEESTTGLYKESGRIDLRNWKIIDSGGDKYLWINSDIVTLTTGRHLRLVGQTRATALSLDAEETDINPSYIIQQAKALLHQQRIDGSGGISEMHDKQMGIAQSMADRERSKVFVASRGWRV
jgi:hypothetical protein